MNDDFLNLYKFRMIVCGSRQWMDFPAICRVLDKLLYQFDVEDILLAQGDAPGADKMSKGWASLRQVDHLSFPAKWQKYGKPAGPRRNKKQLFIDPHLVVAFHDDIFHSKGTSGMLKLARVAGVKTKVYKHRSDDE